MGNTVKKWYEKDKLGRETLFEILDDQYICIHNKQKKKLRKHVVNLLALNEHSKRVDHAEFKWIVIGVVLAGLSVVLFKYFFSFLGWYPVAYFFPIILLVVLFSYFAIHTYQKRRNRAHVFYSRYGHVPLVTIPVSKKNEYQAFVAQLEEDIKTAFYANKVSERSLRAGEMKMLRRLRNESYIDPHIYQLAKARILEQI